MNIIHASLFLLLPLFHKQFVSTLMSCVHRWLYKHICNLGTTNERRHTICVWVWLNTHFNAPSYRWHVPLYIRSLYIMMVGMWTRQPVWDSVWWFLKILKLDLPYTPSFMPEYLLKGPKSMCHIDSCTALLCKELLLVSICENNLDVHQHSFVVYVCAYVSVWIRACECCCMWRPEEGTGLPQSCRYRELGSGPHANWKFFCKNSKCS